MHGIIASLLILLTLFISADARAVAYCALRDPVNTIYTLFPEATSYRSSVKTVGRTARQAVLEQLPFKMHFNELGRHTLYVALRDGEVAGLVHARSEMTEWGLTEYAWALAPDLTVRGVVVQRSRDPIARSTPKRSMEELVAGADLAELKARYVSAQQQQGNGFNVSLLASAMKTIVITEHVWGEELSGSRALSAAVRVLPATVSVQKVKDLYGEEIQALLAVKELAPSPAFDRNAVQGYHLHNAASQSVGLAIHTPFDLDDASRDLYWILSTSGELLSVHEVGSDGVDADFEHVIGMRFEEAKDCSTIAELAALEIQTLATQFTGG